MFGIDDMALAMIASSAISAGASIFGGRMEYSGGMAANEMTMEMQRRQMEWEERMYKNRHTYEVADLRNAGLNPILSANSAASSPMASAPVMQNPASGFGQLGVSSASQLISGLRSIMEMRTEGAKQGLLKAETEKTQAEASIARANSAKAIKEGQVYGSKWGWIPTIGNIFGKGISETVGNILKAFLFF